MTTPPRTISVLAITASTILGVVLLVGALQIPVPAASLDFSVTPQPDQTPSATAFDVPPIPPAPPPPPDVVIKVPVDGALVADGGVEVRRAPEWQPAPDARVELLRGRTIARDPVPGATAPAADPPVATQQVPEPGFTPMTVRPTLTNAPEVQEVLMREYPAVLRDAGIGGAPVIWLYIGTSGTVDATRVAESSNVQALDEAAQRVARAMRFTPARDGDQVVPVWVQVPIRFAVVR